MAWNIPAGAGDTTVGTSTVLCGLRCVSAFGERRVNVGMSGTERTVAIVGGVAAALATGYAIHRAMERASHSPPMVPASSNEPGSAPAATPISAVPTTAAPTTSTTTTTTTTTVPPPAPNPYSNPVYQHDAPDPTVIRGEDGMYYSYSTQAGYWPYNLINTPVMKSADLTHWEYVADAFPQRPGWVQGDMWAPHIARTGDHYTLFYSARDGAGKMKVGYATSVTPAGPFADRGVLISSGSWGHDIDPFLLQEPNGRTFLYWGSGPEGLFAQEIVVHPDGSITRPGEVVRVLNANPADPQERILVEGAWMQKKGDTYYLMYSAGSWRDNYVVNVARSNSPLGPFEKLGRPILQSGNGYSNTGHHAMITDASGQDWMLYHANVNAHPDWGRAMMLDRVDWVNGWPVVNGGAGPSITSPVGPVTDARAGAAA